LGGGSNRPALVRAEVHHANSLATQSGEALIWSAVAQLPLLGFEPAQQFMPRGTDPGPAVLRLADLLFPLPRAPK
jgi:hypothetical protein